VWFLVAVVVDRSIALPPLWGGPLIPDAHGAGTAGGALTAEPPAAAVDTRRAVRDEWVIGTEPTVGSGNVLALGHRCATASRP
jgi:hypothetical protein